MIKFGKLGEREETIDILKCLRHRFNFWTIPSDEINLTNLNDIGKSDKKFFLSMTSLLGVVLVGDGATLQTFEGCMSL